MTRIGVLWNRRQTDVGLDLGAQHDVGERRLSRTHLSEYPNYWCAAADGLPNL